ncbi:hypothetical protein [Ornithinimicrobium kibberense]
MLDDHLARRRTDCRSIRWGHGSCEGVLPGLRRGLHHPPPGHRAGPAAG